MATYAFNPITGKIDRVGGGSAPPGNVIQTINGISPDVAGDFVIESSDSSVIVTPLVDGVDLTVPPGGVNRDAFNAYVGSPIFNFLGGGKPSDTIHFDTVTVNKNGWYNPANGIYSPGRDSIYCLTYSVTFFGGDPTTREIAILWNGIGYNYFGTRQSIIGEPGGIFVTCTSTFIGPILVGHFMRIAAIVVSDLQNVGVYGTTPITGEAYASTFSGAELGPIT